jgi:hypothetical protein
MKLGFGLWRFKRNAFLAQGEEKFSRRDERTRLKSKDFSKNGEHRWLSSRHQLSCETAPAS